MRGNFQRPPAFKLLFLFNDHRYDRANRGYAGNSGKDCLAHFFTSRACFTTALLFLYITVKAANTSAGKNLNTGSTARCTNRVKLLRTFSISSAPLLSANLHKSDYIDNNSDQSNDDKPSVGKL